MITNTITYIEWMPTQWEYDNIIKPQMSAFDEYEPTAEEMIQMYNELQEQDYMTDEQIEQMLAEMADELQEEFEEQQPTHPMDKML